MKYVSVATSWLFSSKVASKHLDFRLKHVSEIWEAILIVSSLVGRLCSLTTTSSVSRHFHNAQELYVGWTQKKIPDTLGFQWSSLHPCICWQITSSLYIYSCPEQQENSHNFLKQENNLDIFEEYDEITLHDMYYYCFSSVTCVWVLI